MIEPLEVTTQHYIDVRNILGKNYVATGMESPYDFIRIATQGLDANVIKNFREHFDLSLDVTASMLCVSEPSIYRWIKSGKTLDRNVSIKLLEITKLFLHGIEVFQEKENFFKWLNLPNHALGGLQPIELIEIPEGVSKIRNILGRIEHGVYS